MDVVVIGGGASGMMAAITAAGAGARTFLIEGGPLLGKKLLSTGNGRCNFSNLALDPGLYQGSFRRHASLLLKEFGVAETVEFFESIGIPAIEAASARGDDAWLYPACKEASALRMALDMECARTGVEILTEQKISEISKKENRFSLYTSSGKLMEADRIILATGGKAFPKSGSDGSGLMLAKQLGHSLVEPLPALGPLVSDSGCCKSLGGIRAEAKISMSVDGTEVAREAGEVQFTEYGLSGIPVFQLSGRVARELAARHRVSLSLDLVPRKTEEELYMDLAERKVRRLRRESGTLLLGLVPSRMVPVLFKECGIMLHVPCEEIPRDKLGQLAALLKAFCFSIQGTRDFESCQVTSGGIPATEVSLNLESLKVRGLYFAGEILDLDGPCGGYNLQWAWTSGHAAGLAAAKEA